MFKTVMTAILVAIMAGVTMGAPKDLENKEIIRLKADGQAVGTAFMVEMGGKKYLWSIKHVVTVDTISVKFVDETLELKQVYMAPGKDGPVVYEVPESKYYSRINTLKIADMLPAVGTKVYTVGYAGMGAEFTYQEAVLQPGDGKTYNSITNRGSPGQSGSPVLNGNDEVIGIMMAVPRDSRQVNSMIVGFGSIKTAHDTVAAPMNTNTPVKGKGTLIVFTDPSWCGFCRKMEPDLNAAIPDIEKRGLKVEKITLDDPRYPALRNEYLKSTRESELNWPTMWIKGTDQKKIGQQNRRSILGFVLDGLKNIAELLFGYPEEDHVPKPPRREVPPAPAAEGVVAEVEVDEGGSEEPPAPTVESVAWDDVTIVAVVKKTTDKTPVGDVAKRKALAILKTQLQKVNEDALEGKAQIDVVSQRLSPERFDAVVVASGVVPDPIALVVMVKERSLGLKSLIAGTVERKIMAKIPESTKFEIIFERINSSYEEMQKALLTPSPERFERETPALPMPEVKPEGMSDEQYQALLDDNAQTRSTVEKGMDAWAAFQDKTDEDGEEKSTAARIIAAVLAFLGMERATGFGKVSIAKTILKRVYSRFDDDEEKPNADTT